MVTRGKHILHFTKLDGAAKAHRLSALQTVMQPVITLAPTYMESNEWVSKFKPTVRSKFIYNINYCYLLFFYPFQYNLLNGSLPANIHILTLEYWRKDQVLLRIEHIFERDEDRFLSLPETVHLQVSIYTSFIMYFKYLICF